MNVGENVLLSAAYNKGMLVCPVSLDLDKKPIKWGYCPENPNTTKKRLASFAITVGGVPQAFKQTMMAIHDVDNEEMEALRRVVPEWSKNSTLLPMGRDKNGYLKYVDFSYTNAYDALTRPFRAVVNRIGEFDIAKSNLYRYIFNKVIQFKSFN